MSSLSLALPAIPPQPHSPSRPYEQGLPHGKGMGSQYSAGLVLLQACTGPSRPNPLGLEVSQKLSSRKLPKPRAAPPCRTGHLLLRVRSFQVHVTLLTLSWEILGAGSGFFMVLPHRGQHTMGIEYILNGRREGERRDTLKAFLYLSFMLAPVTSHQPVGNAAFA